MNEFFARLSQRISEAVGSPWAFIIAAAAVLSWALSGPLFHYSSGWQLVINTGTTIITFLMVFLIQNAQNRDQRVLQLKLDELIKSIRGARTGLVDLEHLSEEELEAVEAEFKDLSARHAAEMERIAAKAVSGAKDHADKAKKAEKRASEAESRASQAEKRASSLEEARKHSTPRAG